MCPRCRTACDQRLFAYRTVHMYNELPTALTDRLVGSFCRALRRHLAETSGELMWRVYVCAEWFSLLPSLLYFTSWHDMRMSLVYRGSLKELLIQYVHTYIHTYIQYSRRMCSMDCCFLPVIGSKGKFCVSAFNSC